MVTYTTRFPINQTLTPSEFVKVVIRWNQGSRFDKIDDLIWDGTNFECSWRKENVSLAIQSIQEKEIVGSRLQKEDEHGIWYTDFVLDYFNKMLTIIVSLETTELTTDFFPTYYPPFFVKMIIFGGYSGDDNGVMVSNKEHCILDCLPFFKGIVNKTIVPNLPVVFVTQADSGENLLDVNKLAFRLQGVAHVLCEPVDKTLLEDFTDMLDSDNTKAGKIYIYYPSRNKKSKVFNLTSSNKDADFFEDRVVNEVYNYMNLRMRQSIDTWDGLLTEKLHIENGKLLSNQNAIVEENSNLYDVFGEQIEKMEESNIKLSNEVQRLTAELQGLRMRYSDKCKTSIIYLGEEREFYTDEIKEIVLDIISEYQKNCREDSRRWHIISDLLENNEFQRLPEKRKNQLKNALKGYRSLNGSLQGLLETLGFEISDDGKHYKWTYYGDHRYVATAAKTCSDGRAGLNLSSIIEKLMF